MSYEPYALAFPTAAFAATSPDFAHGGALPVSAYGGSRGPNQSPALHWDRVPAGTRSFVVTAFDADAPIPGGLWHWAVKDLPATCRGVERSAGDVTPSSLPPQAVSLPNDLGIAGYAGVNPPPGTGTHRLFLCVTALDVERLALPEHASLSMLHILMIPHTLGRAILVGTSTAP